MEEKSVKKSFSENNSGLVFDAYIGGRLSYYSKSNILIIWLAIFTKQKVRIPFFTRILANAFFCIAR